ncbi:hypothetical protein CK203_035868 [Vitis vinifera]|uniref:TLDc domain-containing protein n=1 Tax=Vitis vinifera TaxID=29760 RepID=A0A438I071_VITVI|nr:hypothetical protein CK203_035868 [Vitis vinifera]
MDLARGCGTDQFVVQWCFHSWIFQSILESMHICANRYFYLCLNDLLALGGGGNFALCLDEDLLSGTSGPCETFGNLCLAHNPEFELKNVEVLLGFLCMF